MNCDQVGKLIYQLRKEKGMTQKQLADQMNISDKTISKWERGLGCPDVSLLHQLSELLGVNIEKLLQGRLDLTDMDGGNMRNIKFYMCPVCGNVMTSLGQGEVSCCGRKLSALTVGSGDEQHQCKIETVEDEYYITFSHPMTKDHYITFFALVSYDSVLLVKLYPEQGGEARIPRFRRGKLYAACSQHGLWEQTIK